MLFLKIILWLINREATGKHTAPVWQLYWVDVEKGRDDDTGEVLMSISTGLWLIGFFVLFEFIFLDGRVTQWLLRKGFESNGKKKKMKLCIVLVCLYRLYEIKTYFKQTNNTKTWRWWKRGKRFQNGKFTFSYFGWSLFWCLSGW